MFPLQGPNQMSAFASSGMMFNPIAMLFQGLQQLVGGGMQQQGGCHQQGPGNSPFGCCPGGANNFASSFGGNAYQAGFQAGQQAAQGGPQNAYQAGFQQGMQAAQGGFGGPGFGNNGFGNPLAQILSLLSQLMGGGGMPFGGGNPGGGFQPPFGGLPGGGIPGGGFQPNFGGGFPGGGFQPNFGGGNFFPNQGQGSFNNGGPVTQQSLGNPAISQLYNQSQGNGQALRYTAGMQIDCDGSGSSHGDPCFQSQTSARLANGQSLNADTTPYVVLPPQLAKQYGVKLGDLCLVRHGDKVSPAIFGDVGPRNKLGEGSVRLAQNLGINSSPTRGGTSGGVEYQVFPGSGRGVKLTNENTTTEALWQRIQGMQGRG